MFHPLQSKTYYLSIFDEPMQISSSLIVSTKLLRCFPRFEVLCDIQTISQHLCPMLKAWIVTTSSNSVPKLEPICLTSREAAGALRNVSSSDTNIRDVGVYQKYKTHPEQHETHQQLLPAAGAAVVVLSLAPTLRRGENDPCTSAGQKSVVHRSMKQLENFPLR